MKWTIFAVALLVGGLAAAPAKVRPPTLQEVQDSNQSLVRRVAELQREITRLERQLKAAQEDLADHRALISPKLTPEIEAAIKDRKLVLGMAVVDANKALMSKGRLTEEDEAGKTYEWAVELPEDKDPVTRKIVRPTESYHAFATFDAKGRLVRHWR